MTGADKTCALLRLMAGRQGQRITSRDVATLQMAAALVAEQDDKLAKSFRAWREQAEEAINARAHHSAMVDGLRALLELHA